MSALDGILDELAERLAARVADRLKAPAEANMIAQTASPLGARRHCAAVKRRVANGSPGASIVGRKHLLSAEALSEELARASVRSSAPAATGASVRGELLAELELLRGGKDRMAEPEPGKSGRKPKHANEALELQLRAEALVSKLFRLCRAPAPPSESKSAESKRDARAREAVTARLLAGKREPEAGDPWPSRGRAFAASTYRD